MKVNLLITAAIASFSLAAIAPVAKAGVIVHEVRATSSIDYAQGSAASDGLQ